MSVGGRGLARALAFRFHLGLWLAGGGRGRGRLAWAWGGLMWWVVRRGSVWEDAPARAHRHRRARQRLESH